MPTQSLPIPPSAPSRASADVFRRDSMEVMSQLRSSLINLSRSFPGGFRTSQDGQKLLGLDAKLSWQLFRMVSRENLLEISQHVPSATPMQKLLKAAKKHGVSDQTVSAVNAAYSAFEDLVEVHAGDRTTFESMLAAVGEAEATGDAEVANRKLIYEGTRQLWGIQVDTFMRCVVLYPSEKKGKVDYGNFRSKISLRRMRVNALARVDSAKVVEPVGSLDPFQQQFVDVEAGQKYGVPIIPEFCSKPLPELELKVHEDGLRDASLAGDAIGKLGSSTLTFGHVSRDAILSEQVDGRLGMSASCMFSTPTRLFITDILIHRPTFGRMDHQTMMFAGVTNISTSPAPKTHAMLPFKERLAYVGSGEAALQTQDAERYAEMVSYSFKKVRWNLEEMDVYRLRVEYPIVASALTVNLMLRDDSPWHMANKTA